MFRSRWGFHPCDYETYRKLKFLHLIHEKAIRLAAAWQRWYRKERQNRVIRRRIRNEQGQVIGFASPVPMPEPAICSVFSRKVSEKRQVDRQGRWSKEGFVHEKVITDSFWIAQDYASARKPARDAAEVRAIHHNVAEIDAMVEKARQWIEEQDIR